MALGLVDQPIAFLASGWIWPALITIITWNTLPLVTLTFLPACSRCRDELIEAARIDGANRLQLMRHVYLPHLQAGDRRDGADVDVLDLQQLRLRLADHRRGARASTPTSWRPRSTSRPSSTAGFGYSSAAGVVMATMMTVFGLLYLRVIAARELGGGALAR